MKNRTGSGVSPQPKTGAPLSSEDVGLLVAGDVCRWRDGSLVLIHEHQKPSDALVCAALGKVVIYGPPEDFTFIGRSDADGWIPAPEGGWGENPVPGMVVDVRFSDGDEWIGDLADEWGWKDPDLIAFRLPDHISEVREKVEPANGEVAAAVEADWRMPAALPHPRDAGVFFAAIRVSCLGEPAEWKVHLIALDDETHDVHLNYDHGYRWSDYELWTPCLWPDAPSQALRAQPNGGAK